MRRNVKPKLAIAIVVVVAIIVIVVFVRKATRPAARVTPGMGPTSRADAGAPGARGSRDGASPISSDPDRPSLHNPPGRRAQRNRGQ